LQWQPVRPAWEEIRHNVSARRVCPDSADNVETNQR
jgi:hypothetical protein